MSPEAKQARAEYMREWRKRPGNKEKLKEINQRYWERKAQKAKEINE